MQSRAAVLPLLAGLVLLCSATRAQATDLTRPPPVSLTAGNKSFPWQLRSWLPPNKNTTVGALGRAVGSVANSSNPLNTTKAVAQGLALYKQETKALILGQAGIVSFVNSVNISASSGSPITCFVDPSTGQLVGLEQAGLTACSLTGDVTVVPTSAGYISQIKLAYTYDGAFIGRLVFDLKANATAKPVSYTCGSAGGKAVDLLPSKGHFVVTKLGAGCAPLPSVAAGSVSRGRRRRSLSAAEPGTGLSARGITVAAAALASLPIDPMTGVPQTPQLGDVIVPQGDPTPVPTPLPPVVTSSTDMRALSATTLVIAGSGFDPIASGNTVTFATLGAIAGTVTAASSTSLTVSFSTPPMSVGSLDAVVTSFGGSSGAPVQVATVVLSPVVYPETNDFVLDVSPPQVVITGSGFDPIASGNMVTFTTLGAVAGTITSASRRRLTVSFSTLPASTGSLDLVVMSFGGSSGATVQVATVMPFTLSTGVDGVLIPNPSNAGISKTLVVNVPAERVIASMSVTFFIRGQLAVQEIFISLQAPNGQVLNLVDALNSIDFIGTVISSAATISVNTASSPFSGTYLPSATYPTSAPTAFTSTTNDFSQLFSQPSGSWTLAVALPYSGGNPTFFRFEITLNYA